MEIPKQSDGYDFENDNRIQELWASRTVTFIETRRYTHHLTGLAASHPPFSKTKQGNPKTKNQQQLSILETDLKKGQCCTNFEETTNSGCVAGFERVVSPPNTSRVASWLCHSNWCPRPRSPRCRSGTVGEAMAARLAPDTSTKIIKFPA